VVADILHTALDARELSQRRRRQVVADLTERVELLAEQAHPHDANRTLVAHLHNERHALFTFLLHPGVDATNWRAEQAIRPAVVNRKVWGGNRTRRGADTQGRIMSVLRTAAQQGVDPVDWLARFARAPDLAVVPLFIPR
jgi:transposase